MSSDPPPVCSFIFKKSTRKPALRSRQPVPKDDAKEKKSSDSDMTSSDEEETRIVTKDRKKKSNPLVQSTRTFTGVKRKLAGKTEESSDEDDESESVVSVAYKSDRSARMQGPTDGGATATIEIDTPADRDARAIFERARKMQDQEVIGEEDSGSTTTYKGINNYKKFIVAKDNTAGSAMSSENAKGPVRAPANIRSTVRWDYKPDLCKDYKETGYCGFGDSCIFMHDRTDYKSGWQIEMEYEAGQYGTEDGEDKKYEVPEEENIPFKCLICRKSFDTPVVTKCRHYFCQSCALSHYRTSTRCYVCQTQTSGIFNPAQEIARRLKRRRIEREERQQHQDDESQDEEEKEVMSEEEEDAVRVTRSSPHEHREEEDDEDEDQGEEDDG